MISDPTLQKLTEHQTAQQLFERCQALRRKLEQDIEQEKQRQKQIQEHEYMGLLNDVVK